MNEAINNNVTRFATEKDAIAWQEQRMRDEMLQRQEADRLRMECQRRFAVTQGMQ